MHKKDVTALIMAELKVLDLESWIFSAEVLLNIHIHNIVHKWKKDFFISTGTTHVNHGLVIGIE